MQLSASQHSCCWVELTALLIGTGTLCRTADNTLRLDFTCPALQAICLALAWHMLLSQARPFVIAFFSGAFNAFAHKPAAVSTAAAADTHMQPG